MESQQDKPDNSEHENEGRELTFRERMEMFAARIKIPRWLNTTFRIFLGIFFGGFVLVALVMMKVYNDVPSHEELKYIENQTATHIYSQDGKLMGKYYLQDRTNISFHEISPHVVDALIATEDARFYEHSGVDRRSMMRVLFKSVLMGDRSSGGGSTLSQQLAKNLFPRQGSGAISLMINKAREIITAWKLERIYEKEEILTFYLNTVSFGENAFGIHTAARRFFNKLPSQLNTQEAAVLVGMLKAPTTYNPRRNPEKSKERRNVVFAKMAEHQYISPQQADSLSKLDIEIDYTYQTHNQGMAPYLREVLRKELAKWAEQNNGPDGNPYNIYSDGLRVYTTIDSRMQMIAEKAVTKHMRALQQTFYRHWGGRNPWGKDNDPVMVAMRRSDRYLRLKEAGMAEKDIVKEFTKPVKMTLYHLSGEKTDTIAPLDSIKHYLKFLHAGFLAVEAGTGHVKAWVGGINHEYFKYDHVNSQAKRQVGSTFKPIVYAAALEAGVEPCEYFSNERDTYEEWQNWSPRNADGKYGGEYSMKGALTNSVNTVSAQMILRAGINRVVQLARKMGIKSDLEPVPSLALGTADISLFEMVGAYTAFANNGVHTPPVYIDRIEDKFGNIVYNPGKERSFNQAITKNKAAIMNNMLQNVVSDGTASRIRWRYGIQGDVAGKTGTTQSQSDGWFIGYTPRLIAGAWVGADDRRVHFRSLSLGQGANTALPIWGEFMAGVKKDTSLRHYLGGSFDDPDDWMLSELDCEPYRTGPPADSTFFDNIFHDLEDFFSDPFGSDSSRNVKRQEREDRKVEKEKEREKKKAEREENKKKENSGEPDKKEDEAPDKQPAIQIKPITPAGDEESQPE